MKWHIHKFGEHITSSNGDIVAELTERNGDRVQCQSNRIERNARLIAKSPEMLKCLKYLVGMIDEAPFELSHDQEAYRVYAHEVINKIEDKNESD